MLATFIKDLRLILRDRLLVLFSLVVPIVVITLISAALFGGAAGPRLTIAVVDEDGGPVARDFKTALAERADVVEVDRAQAERFVRDRNAGPLAIVFPPGLSDNYQRGRPTEIPLLTDPAQQSNLEAARILLMVMEKRAEAMADPLAEQLLTLREQNLTGNRLAVTPFEQNVPGFTLMFVLVAVIFSTALGLHDERDWGTWSRLQMAPIGLTRPLLGKLAARTVLGMVQMAVLLLWSRAVFGVSLGSSPLGVAALTAAVVAATAVTGLLVASLTRTREQAQPFGLAVVVLLSGLGGLWWPTSMEPGWMRTIAPAVYTSWAMRGLNDLVLRDRGLAALTPPLLALGLYSAVGLVIGTALFRRRCGAR
jgi:ABC-type multidrug transport system permease subunit